MTTKFYQYEAVKDGLGEVKKLVERLRNDDFIKGITDLHAINNGENVAVVDLMGNLGKCEGDTLDNLINDILIDCGFYGEYQRVGLLNLYYND